MCNYIIRLGPAKWQENLQIEQSRSLSITAPGNCAERISVN